MAQGLIANKQRCINLYPEKNPIDSPVPITHYMTPGLEEVSPGLGIGRGIWTASDGTFYGVSGTKVWWRSQAGVVAELGTVPLLQTPVKFADNGTDLVLVDGTTTNAWVVNLKDKTFKVYPTAEQDEDDLFAGATFATYLDTFLVFNKPGTRQFISTLSNTLDIDGTYFAEKTGFPDPLVAPVTVRRELWLIGTKSTEIWTTSPDQDFPFTIIPGAFVEYGALAPYSIATMDVSIFWLGQNDQGGGIVLQGKGYVVGRVSTHAIEQEIQKYSRIDDAIGYTYQENGHIFYVLTFPSADKTWVYDEATQMWHERAWMDSEGKLRRHRVVSATWAYNKLWGQDWETGTLYEMNSQLYTDNGSPIVRVRSFPHLPVLEGRNGKITLEGKRIKYYKFTADIEVGTMPETSITEQIGESSLLAYDARQVANLITQARDGIDTENEATLSTDETEGEAFPPLGFLEAEDGEIAFGILLDNTVIGVPGPKFLLRWSNTRGASWQGERMQTLGSTGEYYNSPMFRRLGLARDRIWELSWTAPCLVSLNGAWVELEVMKS